MRKPTKFSHTNNDVVAHAIQAATWCHGPETDRPPQWAQREREREDSMIQLRNYLSDWKISRPTPAESRDGDFGKLAS